MTQQHLLTTQFGIVTLFVTCDMIVIMEQVLTLVCKLNPASEQVAQIGATLKAFADACNYANRQVRVLQEIKDPISSRVTKDFNKPFFQVW